MNATQQRPLQLGRPTATAGDLDAERDEIRAHYSRLRLAGSADVEAFDRCDDLFGYVQAVRALRAASPHAKQLSDTYWRKRRASR